MRSVSNQILSIHWKESRGLVARLQQNVVMSPSGLGTKDDCAGEDQQQFTKPTD
jgi:hypothetical protein